MRLLVLALLALPAPAQQVSNQDLDAVLQKADALLEQHPGANASVQLAQAMGVRQSKLDPVLSLALGTSSVTLREMVVAYATIANMRTGRVFSRRREQTTVDIRPVDL